MSGREKPGAIRARADQEVRDKEVIRANRELAAYFRGQRTEREARAALKTIKSYVRERERQDPGSRLPLPGMRAAPAGTRPASKTSNKRIAAPKPARPLRERKPSAARPPVVEPRAAVERQESRPEPNGQLAE